LNAHPRTIELYRADLSRDWDAFVRRSRNGTFLFERGYMDYHADRFDDFSLVVRDQNGRITALLPANRDGDRVVSHGGLTYGGFILDSATRTASTLEIFSAAADFLRASGVRELIYKPVPHIYHLEPCEEDLYALFRMKGQLIKRDLGACACPADIEPPSRRARWFLRKAEHAGISIEESEEFEDFWPILEGNLASRHQLAPTHSVSEIRLLKSRFPTNIRLFVAKRDECVLAGLVVYETPRVAHLQYSGSTEEGRALGATRLIVSKLLRDQFSRKRWFDYGISTDSEGLNSGLQAFKESLGLRAVVSDRYQIELR